MKIVALSDTHWKLKDIKKIPEGDVFVFAGDWSVSNGGLSDVITFATFLKKVPCTYKLIVAGNHDFCAQQEPAMVKQLFSEAGATYLMDSGETINNVHFWGSPWTPLFMNWAFMKEDYELAKHWNAIPKNTDVLITHGPAYGILDKLSDCNNVGSQTLEERIKNIKPAVHIFGHIHCGYGTMYSDNTTFYNVSVCDDDYNLVNKPTIIEV